MKVLSKAFSYEASILPLWAIFNYFSPLKIKESVVAKFTTTDCNQFPYIICYLYFLTLYLLTKMASILVIKYIKSSSNFLITPLQKWHNFNTPFPSKPSSLRACRSIRIYRLYSPVQKACSGLWLQALPLSCLRTPARRTTSLSQIRAYC